MHLDLSISGLFAGLVFGSFGIYYIQEGKSRRNFYWLGIGVTMIIFPYLTESALVTWLFGLGLFAAAYYTKDF